MRAEVKAMLLVDDAAVAVICYGIAYSNAFNCIIQPMVAGKIGLRILLTKIQAGLCAQLFGNNKRLRYTDAGCISVATHVESLQRTIRNMNAVGAVLHIKLSAAVTHRTRIAQAKALGAVREHSAHTQGITHTCQATVSKEQACTVFTTGITTCVIGIHRPDDVLWLIGSNHVVCSAGLTACLHGNAQLGIVGSVKAQQILVNLVDISNAALLQGKSFGNIAAFGMLVAFNYNVVSFTLNKSNVYYALLNCLCG